MKERSSFEAVEKFLSFRTLSQKNLAVCQKHFCLGYQNCILRVHGNIFRFTIVMKFDYFFVFLTFFWTVSHNSWFFVEKNFEGFVKTAFYGCTGTFWAYFFFEDIVFFYRFCTLKDKCLDFWQKVSSRVVTTAFSESKRTIVGKLIRLEKLKIESFEIFSFSLPFRSLILKSLIFLSANFQLDCKNFSLRVHRNILR